MNNAFDRATKEPCPVCFPLARQGAIRREMIMPLPEFGPLHTNGDRCCFDCQSAETLVRLKQVPDFPMARLAVGNERSESLRMPKGMAELFGMCSMGLVKPASMDQLNKHLEWLDDIYPIELDELGV